MSDELKCGYGRFDEVKSHPLIRGPLATLDERNAATIATLRAQLADALRERDELRAMLDCAEYRLSKWQRPDNNFGACEIYE